MTNQQYSAKHIRRMKLFERQHLKAVIIALKEQIKLVVSVLKSRGIEAAINSLDSVQINQHLAPPIRDIYKTVGLYFANKTIHDLKQSEKKGIGFGFNDEFLRDILNYFARYLLNKAVLPISETMKSIILNILTEGQQNGWGADKIAMQLESDELTLTRARLIVRTESNKAMNYGQLLGESKSEWESTKKWIAANDHRTRHSHRFIDDTVIDFKDRFHVPIYKTVGGVRGKKKGIEMQIGYDLMTGPGDLHASAGNICNCRCTLSFAAKRDADGRLVRKASAPVLVA
jgi:hypothetical protein